MPSPVGHALAGVAAGYLAGGAAVGARESASNRWLTARKLLSDRRVVLFGLLGVLADIDFLFGVHSMYTHSVGAIMVVALCGALIRSQKRPQFNQRPRLRHLSLRPPNRQPPKHRSPLHHLRWRRPRLRPRHQNKKQPRSWLRCLKSDSARTNWQSHVAETHQSPVKPDANKQAGCKRVKLDPIEG